MLGELDRFGPNEDLGRRLSEQHAHVLPASFRRPEVHVLIGGLLAAVLRRRDGIPTSVAPADAVAWLDAHALGWREELPLSVEDDAAHGLLAGLIRETVALRSHSADLNTLVNRTLVNDGVAWRPMLTFTLDGVVPQDGPIPLGTIAGGATRARLRATGDLEGVVGGPLALLQAERSERREWRVEPLSAARAPIAWPLNAPVELALRVDNATVQTFAAPGGEPASQEPLVFDAIDDEVPLVRLRLIGSGSTRTRRDRLFVACHDGTDLIPSDGATVRALGPIGGTGLTIHEVAGTIRWRDGGDGLSVVFRTGSDDEARSRLSVDGRAPNWDVGAPLAVLGHPVLREVAGGTYGRPVPPGDLRWRPAGGGAWQALPRDGSWPCGLIDVVLVRGGEALDRLRLAVLPQSAQVRIEAHGPRRGRLVLEGFGAADLRVDRNELGGGVRFEVEPVGSGVAIALDADGKPPSRVPLVASWPGQGEVCCRFPFPVRGGGFIDARGQWLRAWARLPLDQLYGVRAVADPGSGDAEIFGWLKADRMDDRSLWIRHRFQGTCSLASLRGAMLNLLAVSQDLDAVVRLMVRCGGQESEMVEVCRVDLKLKIQDESIGIDPHALAMLDEAERADIEMVCRPITDLDAPEEPLPSAPSTDGPPAWVFRKDSREPGPWLIYGRVRGRHRFRPRAVPVAGGEAPDAPDTLGAISRIADFLQRQSALRDLLDAMTADPQHAAWQELDQSLQAVQGRLPLTTLDGLRLLPDLPDALTVFVARAPAPMVGAILGMQDELPFLWAALPLRSWVGAFAAAERGLAALLVAGGQTEDRARALAARVTDDTLGQVENELPLLFCTAALVREHLGRARPGDCTLARLGMEPFRLHFAGSLAELRMGLRRRNDGARWPDQHDFRGVVTGLPREHLDLPQPYRPVLDAPFAAARLAASGAPVEGQTLRALRLCRAFDPEWFDEAYVFALGLAASEPDMIACWSA
ncbi:hypothetical protein TSH100_00705 [Azospirillum sp. TSH100]|nr:hypothetical protein TSH100_00705 [Azospirillum sp. TSH100]